MSFVTFKTASRMQYYHMFDRAIPRLDGDTCSFELVIQIKICTFDKTYFGAIFVDK